MRGSRVRSRLSSRITRPSSGAALREAGKLTAKDAAPAPGFGLCAP